MSAIGIYRTISALGNFVRSRIKADMAERGVSQLVSVDLGTVVQFREAG